MTVCNMYEVFTHELGDLYGAEHQLQEDRSRRAQSARDGSFQGVELPVEQ